jgi:hypothetical protein
MPVKMGMLSLKELNPAVMKQVHIIALGEEGSKVSVDGNLQHICQGFLDAGFLFAFLCFN